MQHKKGTNPFESAGKLGSSASQIEPSPARTSVKSLGSAGRSQSAGRAGKSVHFNEESKAAGQEVV